MLLHGAQLLSGFATEGNAPVTQSDTCSMLTLNRRRVLAAVSAAFALPLTAPLAPVPALARAQAQDDRTWPPDGWTTVEPDELGIDPAVFETATSRIQSESPTLSTFVVAVGGNLVYEYYADGFADDDTTDIWSSTKSVTSAVIGIAVGDGLLALDDRIGDVLGDRMTADADPAAANITVRDLLTMSSGWDWDGTVDYANLDNTDDWAAGPCRCRSSPGGSRCSPTTPVTATSCRSSSRPSPGRPCGSSPRSGCSGRSGSKSATGWNRRRPRRPAARACS